MKPIETAIVRIFAQNKTSIVGVGFLIDGKHVMTCAHVVAKAFGIARDATVQDLPVERITLDFPLVDDNHPCTALVVLWLPPMPDETGDIAVLELDQQRPFSTTPVKLVEPSKYWDKPFGTYGYPQSIGGWASGVVRGRIAGNRLQIINKDEKSYFIQPGFSGSPVYCDEAGVQGVIGMVASGETDPNLDVGFMIPAEVLIKAKDQQNVQPLPSPELTDVHKAVTGEPAVSGDQSSRAHVFSREFAPRVVYIGKFVEMQRQLKLKHVFVAHPFFDGDAQKLNDYRYYLKDGLESIGYEPLFARDDPGYLLETICRDIIDTEAGIYDVTGYNANVLIELGMSIGLNQPTVVIAEDDNAPLIPPLQQLNPIRYESRIDLTELIGPAVRQRIQTYRQSGMSPRFCASCGLDCIARKPRQSPEAEYLVIGADPQKDKAIFHHLKKAVKNFELTWQQIEGDFNLDVCRWTEEIKRCKLVFFHSKEGTTRHSRSENAATMVRVGIAVGMGIAWRMILKHGDRMPTDLEGFKYTSWGESPTVFETALGSAVRQLLGEARPYGGIYDPLVPMEIFEGEDDNMIVIESEKTLEETVILLNVPALSEEVSPVSQDLIAVRSLLLGEARIVVVQGQPGVGKTTLATMLCYDSVVQSNFRDGVFWLWGQNMSVPENAIKHLKQIISIFDNETMTGLTIEQTSERLGDIMRNRSCLFVLDSLDALVSSVNPNDIIQMFRPSLLPGKCRLLITSRRTNMIADIAQVAIYTLARAESYLSNAGRKVFISYARVDGFDFAERLAHDLELAKIDGWLDTLKFRPGSSWQVEVDNALKETEAMLVIITPGSTLSSQLESEWVYALDNHIPIIPLLVKDSAIPSLLSVLQYIDFRTDYVSGLNSLLEYLSGFFQRRALEQIDNIPDLDSRVMKVAQQLEQLVYKVLEDRNKIGTDRRLSFRQLWDRLNNTEIEIPSQFGEVVGQFWSLRNQVVHSTIETSLKPPEIEQLIQSIQPVLEWLQTLAQDNSFSETPVSGESTVLHRVAEQLIPFMNNESRRGRIEKAFPSSTIAEQVDYSGNSRDFTIRLVQFLDQYGDYEPGKPALVLLLTTLLPRVTSDIKGEIQQLIDEISGMSIGKLNEQARQYRDARQFEQALKLFEQILSTAELRNDFAEQLDALFNIGVTYKDQGNLQLALDYLHRSVSLYKQNNGPYSIQSQGIALLEIAEIHEAMSNIQQALDDYEQAVDLFTKASDSANSILVTRKLADLHVRSGNHSIAIALYNRLLEHYLAEDDSTNEQEIRKLIGNIDNAISTEKSAKSRIQQQLLIKNAEAFFEKHQRLGKRFEPHFKEVAQVVESIVRQSEGRNRAWLDTFVNELRFVIDYGIAYEPTYRSVLHLINEMEWYLMLSSGDARREWLETLLIVLGEVSQRSKYSTEASRDETTFRSLAFAIARNTQAMFGDDKHDESMESTIKEIYKLIGNASDNK